MRKAIFLDIDGTLLDCFNGITEITPQVEQEIRMLQAEGNVVFIATGRPYPFIDNNLLTFGFDGFILINGAQVRMKEQMLCGQPMEAKFVNQLIAKLEDKSVEYLLEDESHVYMKACHKTFYEFFERAGIAETCFKQEYDTDQLNVYKIEILCPTEEILNECVTFIKQYPQYGYFHSIDKVHLEVYLKENTKAEGIRKALAHLNIPIENTYAFGDGKNDIEMLQTVGCGIAMGNASDEVKQYAKVVTDTVHNDGVAVGIRKYIREK